MNGDTRNRLFMLLNLICLHQKIVKRRARRADYTQERGGEAKARGRKEAKSSDGGAQFEEAAIEADGRPGRCGRVASD